MDFTVYSKYIPMVVSAIDYNHVSEIELPFDLHYYEEKGDAEPIITLSKGTKVYCLSDKVSSSPPTGYGFSCRPDYQKEWRYGYPFFTETFSYVPQDTPM